MNVYDFDGTVYDGDSSVDFYLFSLRNKPLIIFLLPYQGFMYLLFIFRICPKEKMKEAFFSFLQYIPAETTVMQFWKSHSRKIKSWYLRQKNNDDVIISASPEFLLAPFVRDQLQAGLIASIIDPRTGAFTGKNCHGAEKMRRFHEAYGDGAEIDAFYSDSVSDAPLASMAKRAFLVKGGTAREWPSIREKAPLSLPGKIKETFFTKDFFLFVFCGGCGTLANFVFSLLISTHLNPSLAYACGYAISLFAAYSLNAKLIFHRALSAGDFGKFILSYIPNFLILFSFVLVFLNILKWHKVIVYALSGLLGLPVTFVLVKLMVFRKKRASGSSSEGVI